MLETCRAATHDMHLALHRHPLLAPLEAGTVTLKLYSAILGMFHAVYTTLEGCRAGTLHQPGLPDAPVLDWLEADLRLHQGGQLPHAIPGHGALCENFVLDTPSRQAGYLYVKQGSTLGGQLISRRLEQALGLAPGVGNRFFHGYGPETGRQWRAFKEGVTLPKDGLEAGEAAAAARAVFDRILQSCDLMMKKALDDDTGVALSPVGTADCQRAGHMRP